MPAIKNYVHIFIHYLKSNFEPFTLKVDTGMNMSNVRTRKTGILNNSPLKKGILDFQIFVCMM